VVDAPSLADLGWPISRIAALPYSVWRHGAGRPRPLEFWPATVTGR